MVDRFPMMLSFEAASVRGPPALGTGSSGLSVWTFDQFECGNGRAFQPKLQRSPANFAGSVAGVRYQEPYFSAFVLSAAIALDDCRHLEICAFGEPVQARLFAAIKSDPLRELGCSTSLEQQAASGIANQQRDGCLKRKLRHSFSAQSHRDFPAL